MAQILVRKLDEEVVKPIFYSCGLGARADLALWGLRSLFSRIKGRAFPYM